MTAREVSGGHPGHPGGLKRRVPADIPSGHEESLACPGPPWGIGWTAPKPNLVRATTRLPVLLVIDTGEPRILTADDQAVWHVTSHSVGYIILRGFG